MKRRSAWTDEAPYHVLPRKVDGHHEGYDVACRGVPFLRQVREPAEVGFSVGLPPRLKRHEAYAIVRLLNTSTEARKWAKRFSDPYVRHDH